MSPITQVEGSGTAIIAPLLGRLVGTEAISIVRPVTVPMLVFESKFALATVASRTT